MLKRLDGCSSKFTFWSPVVRSGSGGPCSVGRGVSDRAGVPLLIDREVGVEGLLADVGVLLPAFNGTIGLMVGSSGALPTAFDLDIVRGGSPLAALLRGSDLRSIPGALTFRGWV